MQSTTSVKAQFNGQFRRFALQSNSFDVLAMTIRSMFNIPDALEVRVRYLDDEGDTITVSSDTELISALQTLSSPCLKVSVDALQKEIVPVANNVPVPKEEKKAKADQPIAKIRKQMPDFVREIIKQKQADKKEKHVNACVEEKPTRSAHRARLLAPRDAPDCEEIVQNAPFTKSWKIRNVGALPWSTEFKLVRVKKDNAAMSLVDAVPITREVAPNEEYEVTVPIRAPNQPGSYESFWRMTDNEGKKFGPRLICKINVVAEKLEQKPATEAPIGVPVDRQQLILKRKQAREERLKKYEAQLAKLKELGFKTNNQHIRLLAEYDGDVDRVVAFIAQKKAQAKS